MERGALMPEYRVEWSIEAETDDLESGSVTLRSRSNKAAIAQ